MSKSPKKRVRFNDTPEYAPPKEQGELAGQSSPKRLKVDPMEALEGEIMGTLCLAEGADAAACAASRRAARRQHLMDGFDDEDGIEGAEAEYEDPEEMFNDGGIPFEPFHLKREREEGYFDEAGNYVEYKNDEVEDAWADELANVEVDGEWLARVMAGPGRQAAEALAAGEEPDMGADQVAAHKRKLVDLLLPGENVLQALRRLAAVRQPAAASADGRASPTAADPLARHPRALASQGAMPPVVRDKFEQLTGLSSVLMEQGVYGVHSMSREALERSILREELAEQAGPQAQQGQAGGQVRGQAQGSEDEEGGPGDGQPQAGAPNGQPAGAAAARAAGAGGEAADAGQALAERLLAAAVPAALSNGKSGTGVNGSGGGIAPAAAAAAPVDAEQDIFAEDDAPAAAPPAEPGSTPPPAGGASAGQPPAQQQAQQQEPAGNAPVGALEPAGVVRDGSGDIAMQDSQQAPAGGAPVAAAQQHAGSAAALNGSQQQQQQQQPPSELEGFVRDLDSGWLYNSELGMYYDPQRQLFGEAASGRWYSFDASTGQYTLAS